MRLVSPYTTKFRLILVTHVSHDGAKNFAKLITRRPGNRG